MTDDAWHIEDLFGAHLADVPRRAALVSEEGEWSVTELEYLIEEVKHSLRGLGIRPGHRIAVLLPAGHRAFSTLVGSIMAGAFVTLLSNALGPAARRYRLDAFAPDLVIDHDGWIRNSPVIATPPVSPADAGRLVLWTTGSTGLPRGIVLEWRGILWNARANAAALGIGPADRALVLLDGAYCYALVHQVLTHFVVGGSVAIPRQPAWLEATGRFIERFKPTTLAVVPSALRSLLTLPRLHAPLSQLRLLTVGGAVVDESLLRYAQKILPGVQIVVTYGLAEAGPRVATRFFRADEQVLAGTVGKALPGFDVRVEGDGQIFLRSPSVRVGQIEEGVVRLAPEWLATGDLGAVSDDGTLCILGRQRQMISRGGIKLSPGEIERVLCTDPDVSEARVVAMAHARLGEVPKALVVPRADATPVSASLARRCLEQLGSPWVPVAFEFVPSLPPVALSWKDAL